MTDNAANENDRERSIDALLSFQSQKLAELLRKRTEIAERLRQEEVRAARAADALSAARALVAARSVGATLHSVAPECGADDYRHESDCFSAESIEDTRYAFEKVGTNSEGADHSKEECCRATGTVLTNDADLTWETGSGKPVGILYSAFQKRFEAPRQSFVGGHGQAILVLPERYTLPKLAHGDRLVLAYWLDRNAGHWREFVRPPRRAKCAGRIGVFATRSPNRPSPVGLSMCVVNMVEDGGRRLSVSGVDVLDETPVLSVRLYNPHMDAFPQSSAGWLDDADVVQPLYYDEAEQECEVIIGDSAVHKLAFIDQGSVVDVHNMVRKTLARSATKAHTGVMPVGAFRVLYEVRESAVNVVDVQSGMRDSVCEEEAAVDPEAWLHQQFKKQFQ